MSADPDDPRWPKVLSLAVHEFRTPITVVNGYLRMLLKDRAGPISDQQRKLLEEAEKSCGRLSALVAEMSDLSAIEAGTAVPKMASLDLQALLVEVIANLPPLPDREVGVQFEGDDARSSFEGDGARLRTAFAAVLTALRRELVTSDLLIVRIVGDASAHGGLTIAIGDRDQIDGIATADPASLGRFDEWRGGCGLSLGIARRIFAQHRGSLHAPPGDGKAGALIVFAA